MDDSDDENNSVDDLSYDASHQACYIFRSVDSNHHDISGPPNKRRKLNGSMEKLTSPTNKRLGLALESRKRIFEDAWPPRHFLTHREDVDEKSLSQLTQYIRHENSSGAVGRLRAALVLSGVDEANYQTVLQSLASHIRNLDQATNGDVEDYTQPCVVQDSRDVLVDLKAQQCSNLQVALRTLVRLAITQASDSETYHNFLLKRKRLSPLNFDLDLLHDFCQQNKNIRIVVSLSDVESFDNHVLNELLPALNIWKEDVPLFLILGIASTRELFEQRLSRSCLRLLDAKEFRITLSANTQSKLLRKVQLVPENDLYLTFDHSTLAIFNDMCHGQGNSTKSLEQMLKLVYASYSLVNPLAGLSSKVELDKDEIKTIAEAARRTDSFKDYCASLLHRKSKPGDQKIKSLLQNDYKLLEEIREQVSLGRQSYSRALEAVYFLADLYEATNMHKPKLQRTRFEAEAQLLRSLSNLVECDIYLDVREKLQELQPREILSILDQIKTDIKSSSFEYQHCITTTKNAATLTNSAKANKARAVAKKHSQVTSNNSDSDLNRSDEDRILNKTTFLDFLKQLVNRSTLDTSTLLLNESYIVPNRSLRLKQYLEPNPRVAIERALISPGDYLGCGCCTSSSGEPGLEQEFAANGDLGNFADTGFMPPASIMFILLQEAPTIINVRDLYDAFESRLQELQIEVLSEGDGSSTAVLMLFYRVLAEMKMLGLVKESAGTQQTKRKAKASKSMAQDADFIAKTSWAGL